jgi:signal transduction histidine kinase
MATSAESFCKEFAAQQKVQIDFKSHDVPSAVPLEHLTVCDSGIGFDSDVAMQRSGLGLPSMRERLKLVNREFSIESQAQLGTTIHASVPFSSGGNARLRLGRECQN